MELTSLPFLLVVGVALPALAWSGRRRLARAEEPADELPSPRSLGLQTIVVQAIVLGLAWLAASGSDLDVALRSRVTPATLAATAGVAVLGLGLAALEARRPLDPGDVVRRELRRVGFREPLWISAMAVAAVVEEVAYRGVLTELLRAPLGTAPAALASAVLFGLGHLVQGWRAAFFGMALGLGFQGIAIASGGLALAMAAHLAYDVGATVIGARLAAREDEGAERERPLRD